MQELQFFYGNGPGHHLMITVNEDTGRDHRFRDGPKQTPYFFFVISASISIFTVLPIAASPLFKRVL